MRKKLYSCVFIVLAVIYVILTATLPTDPEVLRRYQISQQNAHLLTLTLAIPMVLIWLFALYGYLKFYDYSLTIRQSREGRGFNRLSRGLMVLIFSLPFVASMSSVFTYISNRNHSLLPTLTITRNYISLLFPFIAFLLIANGAELLIKTLRPKTLHQAIPKFGLVACIILSSVYTWLITTRPVSSANDIYYLPTVLILTTLAIPYVFIWCRGALAAYHLYMYKSKVKGKIYREALNSLALGMGTIILLSIMLQLLVTVSARLTKLNLSPLLSLIYLLVALTAIGYGLIARGAKKLKQIEEV